MVLEAVVTGSSRVLVKWVASGVSSADNFSRLCRPGERSGGQVTGPHGSVKAVHTRRQASMGSGRKWKGLGAQEALLKDVDGPN